MNSLRLGPGMTTDHVAQQIESLAGLVDFTSRAIELAAKSHYGQYDKQHHPKILHPLRVMAGVTRAWNHMHPALRKELERDGVTINDLRAVGVLHDTLEDTDLRVSDLKAAGFPEHVAQAVASLTRNFLRKETYAEFIERVKLDPIGIHIKLLDLQDNMNRGRGSMTREEHEGLLKRYAKGRAKLESYLFERIEALAEDLPPVTVCTRPPHDGPCNGMPCESVRQRLEAAKIAEPA
jgi:(p)ppGpp synthase/HD superfamily hydrolase